MAEGETSGKIFPQYIIALNQCLFPTLVIQIPTVANMKPILGNRLVLQNNLEEQAGASV